MKTKINEIFSSVQGEGPIVGYKQLFIRFCSCNLKCDYCDTEFESGTEYKPRELFEIINSAYDLKCFHSVSLTGGEPLMCADFLAEFLQICRNSHDFPKIYLETNATLFEELRKIKPYIDIISADIKLKSATGLDTTNLHEKFFSKCVGVETFAKIVFDENITSEEIVQCCEMADKYDLPLILQPKMAGNKMSVQSDFCEKILTEFVLKHNDTRLIPQVHKFLNVR